MKDNNENLTAAPDLDTADQPKASDWLWRPWYAKLWWALTAIYWVCLEGSLLIPLSEMNDLVVILLMILVPVLNPVTVLGVLGYGYMRAKVACGDWVITAGAPGEFEERQRRERMAAEINPADARSGRMHREYLNRGMRRRH